jgi:hypothetical protein
MGLVPCPDPPCPLHSARFPAGTDLMSNSERRPADPEETADAALLAPRRHRLLIQSPIEPPFDGGCPRRKPVFEEVIIDPFEKHRQRSRHAWTLHLLGKIFL